MDHENSKENIDGDLPPDITPTGAAISTPQPAPTGPEASTPRPAPNQERVEAVAPGTELISHDTPASGDQSIAIKPTDPSPPLSETAGAQYVSPAPPPSTQATIQQRDASTPIEMEVTSTTKNFEAAKKSSSTTGYTITPAITTPTATSTPPLSVPKATASAAAATPEVITLALRQSMDSCKVCKSKKKENSKECRKCANIIKQQKFDTKPMPLKISSPPKPEERKQLEEIFMRLDNDTLKEALMDADHLKTIDAFFKRPKATITAELSKSIGSSRDYGKNQDHIIYRSRDSANNIKPDYDITHDKIRQILQRLMDGNMENTSTETLEFIVKGLKCILKKHFNTFYEYRCNKCHYPSSSHALVKICEPKNHIVDEGRYKFSLANEIGNYVRAINHIDGNNAFNQLSSKIIDADKEDVKYEQLFKETEEKHQKEINDLKLELENDYEERLENESKKWQKNKDSDMKAAMRSRDEQITSLQNRLSSLNEANMAWLERYNRLEEDKEKWYRESKRMESDKIHYQQKCSTLLSESLTWSKEKRQLVEENRQAHQKYYNDMHELNDMEERIAKINSCDTTAHEDDDEQVKLLKSKIVILECKIEELHQRLGDDDDAHDKEREDQHQCQSLAFKHLKDAIDTVYEGIEGKVSRKIKNALNNCYDYLNDIKKAGTFFYVNDRVTQNKLRFTDMRMTNIKAYFERFVKFSKEAKKEEYTDIKQMYAYVDEFENFIAECIAEDTRISQEEKEARQKKIQQIPTEHRGPETNPGNNGNNHQRRESSSKSKRRDSKKDDEHNSKRARSRSKKNDADNGAGATKNSDNAAKGRKKTSNHGKDAANDTTNNTVNTDQDTTSTHDLNDNISDNDANKNTPTVCTDDENNNDKSADEKETQTNNNDATNTTIHGVETENMEQDDMGDSNDHNRDRKRQHSSTGSEEEPNLQIDESEHVDIDDRDGDNDDDELIWNDGYDDTYDYYSSSTNGVTDVSTGDDSVFEDRIEPSYAERHEPTPEATTSTAPAAKTKHSLTALVIPTEIIIEDSQPPKTSVLTNPFVFPSLTIRCDSTDRVVTSSAANPHLQPVHEAESKSSTPCFDERHQVAERSAKEDEDNATNQSESDETKQFWDNEAQKEKDQGESGLATMLANLNKTDDQNKDKELTPETHTINAIARSSESDRSKTPEDEFQPDYSDEEDIDEQSIHDQSEQDSHSDHSDSPQRVASAVKKKMNRQRRASPNERRRSSNDRSKDRDNKRHRRSSGERKDERRNDDRHDRNRRNSDCRARDRRDIDRRDHDRRDHDRRDRKYDSSHERHRDDRRHAA